MLLKLHLVLARVIFSLSWKFDKNPDSHYFVTRIILIIISLRDKIYRSSPPWYNFRTIKF